MRIVDLVLRRGTATKISMGSWEIMLRGPETMIEPVAAILRCIQIDEPLPAHHVEVRPRFARGTIEGSELWTLDLPPAGWLPLLAGQVVAAATILVRRYLFAHGGVVGVGGHGWVLIGGSGAGKTSTVGVLVREGAQYLSDEIALLDPQRAVVAPFTLPMALKSWTLAALGDLPPGKEIASDGVTRFYLPDTRATSPLPIAGIVVIGSAQPPGALAPAGRAETLMALAETPSTMRYREKLPEAFPAFAQLLRAVRCYTLGAPGPDPGSRVGLLQKLRELTG